MITVGISMATIASAQQLVRLQDLCVWMCVV